MGFYEVYVILVLIFVTIIQASYCTEECNQPNEEYSPSFDTCPPQTCYSLIHGVMCTAVYRPPQCGCRCIDDYYRNYLNECIAGEDCLKCQKPHEFFSCGSACDNVCETIHTQNRTKCPIINITCNKKCYCEDGYARDKLRNCVRIDQCKRDEEGCDGDPNAQKGRGFPCDRTCKLYNKGPEACSQKICKEGRCECKNGYILNEQTGKCVLPKDCPKKCKKN